MTQTGIPTTLNPESLKQGLDYLSSIDADLGELQQRLGPPPMWERQPGFPTLVHIILEQQVSLASARAAFTKLKEASGIIIPETFLEFSPEELKKIGFSRQKAGYCRELAVTILMKDLDLDDLPMLGEAEVRARLMKVKGIGPWTTDIYLLMVLLRPDSWPRSDLALAVSLQEVKHLAVRPTPEELEELAKPWRPWRAVAARLLWFAYLRKRNLA